MSAETMRDAASDPIQMLWIGELSKLERMALASFVANGHTVHLYAYDDLAGVPDGVQVIDAREILPEEGVSIAIYLETPNASEGKMSLDTVRALGAAVAENAKLYVWPKGKRPLTEAGKYGSLHAKIALADDSNLLISSANLTGYALSLNMEMGLLVRGGETPLQVGHHLRYLVEQGVFERI
jgi:phosphatidylserine/phosphatidylglycerophosphate/cardiolipin synthase-like enzyme